MTKSISFYIKIVLFICFTQIGCKSQDLILAQAQNTANNNYLIEGQFDILEKDHLGNIYLLKQGNQLLKCNIKGEIKAQFSLRGLGNISNIDISNPQKILLYYPDYQNIVFLDNTLSEINRLNLEGMGFWDIQGVAVSRDNNIWIHDPISNRLLKVNTAGNVQLSSNEVYSNSDKDLFDSHIFEYDDRVFLFDNATIREFDNFGHLNKTYNLINQGIQFDSKVFYYLINDKILRSSYQLHFAVEDQIQEMYSGKNIIDFVISKESILIIDNKGLQIIK